MKNSANRSRPASATGLSKTPTGIAGIDEITDGGLPRGRPALICGSAGCGKTLLAMEFLVRGATEFGEPGVFMAFEENEEELTQNVASLGFNLPALVQQQELFMDHVQIERSEIHETGDYDLEGLFVRLGYAIDSIGAKRVVLDTIEALFAGLPNEAILRAELRRLFRWLKDKGVTAIITAERGHGTLTRHGLEEYVADCVIVLDHRIENQVSTRRLRIAKYRGSLHGTNEYPFLIGATGISVLPITSLGLNHRAPTQRISSGIPRLDTMLEGKGYYRGSSILLTGTAGTGKTTLASRFAEAACQRGERTLYFAFEESQSQILRNMGSVGIDLAPWVQKGLLQFHTVRPNLYGLEMHLLAIHDLIKETKPTVVVIDPVTNLIAVGDQIEVRSMLTRLIDFCKLSEITALFTSLTSGENVAEISEIGISSLMDTWLLLRNVEQSGERNRALQVLKARGMAHSNQIREFRLSHQGIELIEVYIGAGAVLTGAARSAQEGRDRAEAAEREQRVERLRQVIARKRASTEAQSALLKAQLEAEVEGLTQAIDEASAQTRASAADRQSMARKRMADREDKPRNGKQDRIRQTKP